MPIISLDEHEVRASAPMAAVIKATRQALIGIERGEFELPHRTALGGGLSLVMPLFHKPTGSSVTKVLSLDADRDPFINGTVTWTARGLVDPIVADAVTVTTLRTGAITGLAVDVLARPDVKTLTIFGAGAQSFDQVRAVLAVRGIREVTVVSRNIARAEATAAILAAEFPKVLFKSTMDGRATLPEAEVIACATTSTTPLFSLADLHETALVTAIGSYKPDMHEFPQDLIATGCGIYVDSVDACMVESGELIDAVGAGILRREAITNLGKALIDGVVPGRRAIFKSVGIAPQDWAAMRVISTALSAGR